MVIRMSKRINIGILGAPLNSSNMGCLALTYSLLYVLNDICRNIEVTYHIFEYAPDKQSVLILYNKIEELKGHVYVHRINKLCKLTSCLRHPFVSTSSKHILNKCDFVIDLTEGDSFTDIYGDERFNIVCGNKSWLINHNIPLILGPQTYGPFNNKQNEDSAFEIISKSYCVIARDQLSADLVNNHIEKEALVTTDLAFQLPFQITKKSSDTIKVGLNPSALLVKDKYENTVKSFKLYADYDDYLMKICEYLAHSDYEVHLIPHVQEDYKVCEKIQLKYNSFTLHNPSDNPIDIKNVISEMDIFVGSRMHATIAAFSSGVVTIPVAYSRKFKGLYESVDYRYIVDLQELTTEDAYNATVEYINNASKLKKAAIKSQEVIKEQTNKTYSIFREIIDNILN